MLNRTQSGIHGASGVRGRFSKVAYRITVQIPAVWGIGHGEG